MIPPIIPFAAAQGDRAPSSERRVWVRYPCKQGTFFQAADNDSYLLWRSEIQNISATGVCLVLQAAVPAGSELLMELPVGLNDPLQVVSARVVRMEDAGEGQWLAGCEFPTCLNEDQLRTLCRGDSVESLPGDGAVRRFSIVR